MGARVYEVRTYFWSHSTLQLIRRDRSGLHKHGALQLTVGIEGPLSMGSRASPSSEDVSGRAILVAANRDHWFESSGWAAVSWMEPESRIGRLFAASFLTEASMVALPEAPLRDIWPQLAAMATAPVSAAEALEVQRALESAWLGEAARTPPLHPALRKAIRHVRDLEVVRISAAELAEVAGVSESYLLHLFGEQLGIPLRRFVLWARMRRAVTAILQGATATAAAHLAGFHDSAHLSRSCKELLAVNPSELGRLREHGHFEVGDETLF